MKNQPLQISLLRRRGLTLAGVVAIGTAIYHGISGNRILREMPLDATDMDFATSTYQLGTMGWVAGGALLMGAARLQDQAARNLIVAFAVGLYGIPAFGTLTLTGGEISLGGALLALVAALAIFGRKALPGADAGMLVRQPTVTAHA